MDKTVESLNYIIQDATEAGLLAFRIGDETAVLKYMAQIREAQLALDQKKNEEFFGPHHQLGA